MARFIADSCPKCDFNSGRATRPILCDNGLMRCDNCGGTWRSLGSAAIPAMQPAIRTPSPILEGAALPSVLHSGLHAVQQSIAGQSVRFSQWLFAGCIALCSAAVVIAVLQFDFAGSAVGLSNSPVEITAVNVRQMQRDGQIAVQVEGRIINRSKNRMPVSEVSIVLTQAKGHKVYSWRHRPAIAFLEPGQSFRFSTANGNVPELASKVEIRSGAAVSSARI